MPNFGPGVPQNLNPAVTPTWVFTPTPLAAATVRIANNGTSTVYLGGVNVSPFNGFPLPPGCRPVELQNCPFTIYTCSNAFGTGATKVVNANALPAGTTTFTVTTSGLAAGPLILGNVGAQEVVNIASVASSTVITLSTGTLYDHVASATVQTAVAQPTNITVTAGVV
jgi:hypothetical protein